MKIIERQMITTNEFEVPKDIIDEFIESVKYQGVPKIYRNDDGKIYAINLLYHDGSTKIRFFFEKMTDEENERLEELLK